MRTEHPLTVTVEQAGVALGVGRSTAYELVHSGELKCVRLRRRIVVPVAYLAETLGVDREAVWAVISPSTPLHSDRAHPFRSDTKSRELRVATVVEAPTLF